MLRLLPVLVLVSTTYSADEFDPSNIDYCQIRCPPMGEVSTACQCTKLKDRKEITNDMDRFRQKIVDAHNRLRNRLARGDESGKSYPSAANMHVLNYDLELEHLARCFLLAHYQGDHDSCRQTSYCKGPAPGQNLYMSSQRTSSLELIDEAVRMWYDELTLIPESIRRARMRTFDSDVAAVGAAHFTQVIWASMIRIGCVRMLLSQSVRFPYVLACNYAGPDERCSGNMLGDTVYEEGPACSKCGDEKCSKIYDALCGKADEGVDGKKEEKEEKKNGVGGMMGGHLLVFLSLFVVGIHLVY